MNTHRNLQLPDLVAYNLLGIGTQDQMHFILTAIDLFKEALKINRATCTGRGNHKLHGYGLQVTG
jgi:hypothetical protein